MPFCEITSSECGLPFFVTEQGIYRRSVIQFPANFLFTSVKRRRNDVDLSHRITALRFSPGNSWIYIVNQICAN